MEKKAYMDKDRFFAKSDDEHIYRIPVDQRLAEVRLISAMEMIIKITLPLAVSQDMVRTKEYQDLVQIMDWLAEAHGFDPVKGMSWLRPEADPDPAAAADASNLPF